MTTKNKYIALTFHLVKSGTSEKQWCKALIRIDSIIILYESPDKETCVFTSYGKSWIVKESMTYVLKHFYGESNLTL